MPPLIEPLAIPIEDVAHVPRRFGVGVMLILMTAFAVLFSIMRSFGTPPEVFAVVAMVFFAVTAAQILLFQGNKPRLASLWAGGVVVPITILVIFICERSNSRDDPVAMAVLLVALWIPLGMLFGYLAGCIMAGVFFIQESHGKKKPPPVEISLAPLAEADFDTLCDWLRNRLLFDLWSQEHFRYPLDHEQLEEHFEIALNVVAESSNTGNPASAQPPAVSSPPPQPGAKSPLLQFLKQPDNLERLAFKAVTGDTQSMVAAIELSNIDRARSRATIELAIVDPMRDDRGQISAKLVRAIIIEAFRRQRLHWLRVVVRRQAVASQTCFRKNGFYDLETGPTPSKDYALLVLGRRYN